jgi:hypothetical protein
LQEGKIENIEHTEAGFDSAVAVVPVEPEAAELVEFGIAGAWPQMAVQMGDNKTPVVQLALMERTELVELMASVDVVYGQGTVVGFVLGMEVAQLGQEGQALLLVVGQGQGLGLVVEWLAGEESVAAASLPAQHQYFLI